MQSSLTQQARSVKCHLQCAGATQFTEQVPDCWSQLLRSQDALSRHAEGLSHFDKVRVDVLHFIGQMPFRILHVTATINHSQQP